MKTSKILFNISAVICFICGALYLFTLVFIPVGIYCFIAARRFVYKADNMTDIITLPNKVLKNWVIFASIACFPIGLVSAVAYAVCTSNNVKIETTQENNSEPSVTISETSDDTEEYQKPEPTAVEAHKEETIEEKQEKYEKLKKFHEKGIITDDELNMAREQLFGHEENKD